MKIVNNGEIELMKRERGGILERGGGLLERGGEHAKEKGGSILEAKFNKWKIKSCSPKLGSRTDLKKCFNFIV